MEQTPLFEAAEMLAELKAEEEGGPKNRGGYIVLWRHTYYAAIRRVDP